MEHREKWQLDIREAVTTLEDPRIARYAFLTRLDEKARKVAEKYRLLVSPYYLSLIKPNDPNDAIAKMAFPTAAEASTVGLRDPIGDLAQQAAPRLTHRYEDRALLHVTNLCPMYCRFCFRKNLMNEREEELYSGNFDEAFAYIGGHPEIEELILTGGDPWMLSNEKISALVDRIADELPAIKRLRFHTRMPVTLPSRINEGLLKAIARPGRFLTFVVTHFNHPTELSAEAQAAIEILRTGGMILLNQTVLLKGVNAEFETLRTLFMGLGNWGVLPYYLHHCDLVAGAEHFRLPLHEGRKIVAALRGKVPGYLLPEYVMELPGGLGKIPVGESFLESEGAGSYVLRSRQGEKIPYRDPASILH
ncbi:MAG: KamA family radical SAM protein [Bdellovibrionota bacterium]